MIQAVPEIPQNANFEPWKIASFALGLSHLHDDGITIDTDDTFLLLVCFNVTYIINAKFCVPEFDIDWSSNYKNIAVQDVCRINSFRNVFLRLNEKQFMCSTSFVGNEKLNSKEASTMYSICKKYYFTKTTDIIIDDL